MDEGKCVSCGLLCKRTAWDYSGLAYHEARPIERDNGFLFGYPHYNNVLVHCDPCCYRGAAKLDEEIGYGLGTRSSEREFMVGRFAPAVRAALIKDRQCPFWTKYAEGFSPSEHLAAWHAERVEKSRREWENSLENDRREWERRMEDDRRSWHRDFQDQQTRFSNRLTLAAVILGLLQVLAAIIAMTPDAWFLKIFINLWNHLGAEIGARLS